MDVVRICECGEDEVYSQKLTQGLCLNCFARLEEDNRQFDYE